MLEGTPGCLERSWALCFAVGPPFIFVSRPMYSRGENRLFERASGRPAASVVAKLEWPA